jgi:hypothetical protein
MALTGVVHAQKPDFSGTWTPEPPATREGGGYGRTSGRRMPSGPITVKQTADKLTVERSMGDEKVALTYNLDGSPSTNETTMRGMTSTATSVAKWDGDKLTIAIKRTMSGRTVETTETWSLEGDSLTIETTGGPRPQKRTYKKTS